ncbi:hypothetical protein ES708_13464 [subsurface metagenome]
MNKEEKRHSRRDFLVGSSKKLAGISALSPLILSDTRNAAAETRDKASFPASASPMVRYDVDSSWPRKPASITWGGIPAVMVDQQDRVWISSRSHPAVQVYDSDGNFLKAWDSPSLFDNSKTGVSLFRSPEQPPNLHYFKFDDDGTIWFANTNRHIVQRCTQDGKLLLTIGTPDTPGEDNAHFNRPTDMTATPEGLFITDGYGNRRVVHYTRQGKFINSWGKEGTAPGDFIDPHAIVHDSKGRLYVADRGNVRIQVFDYNGALLDIWRDLVLPWGLWINDSDEIWVCGTSPIQLENYRAITGGKELKDQIIMKFDTSGKALQIWSFPTCFIGDQKPGNLNVVHGIALDSRGDIYLGEAFIPRVQKFVLSDDMTQVKGEF